MDALVWALTELMVDQPDGWGILEFYRQQAEKIGVAKVQSELSKAPSDDG